MKHALNILTAIAVSLIVSGCVTTDELYARYDSHLCAVTTQQAPGMQWYPVVQFAFDSIELDVGERERLMSNTALLRQHPDYRVVVRGFTDAKGASRYNLKLSKRRVMAVAEVLQKQGVSSTRIKADWAGETLPLSRGNGTDRALDRRVELLLVDETGKPVSQRIVMNAPAGDAV
ncbi:OmpA family protein [Kistimonas asteriae]|uniref:OmpA family protein n=1 Tax=Kistimonas asteriae TaxID=517724 RepID=UPI001BAD6840|nr:OmpA family protein [Kistimonas asteriae]